MSVPETIRIVPDQLRFDFVSHIEHAGRLADGRQFLAFVTGAFPEGYEHGADWQSQKRWLAVLHLCNAAGHHLETRAQSGGRTIDGEADAIRRAGEILDAWLGELKHFVIGPIAIRPFDLTIDGVRFGLIPGYYNYDAAELLPNGIAFVPPWDGTYDT